MQVDQTNKAEPRPQADELVNLLARSLATAMVHRGPCECLIAGVTEDQGVWRGLAGSWLLCGGMQCRFGDPSQRTPSTSLEDLPSIARGVAEMSGAGVLSGPSCLHIPSELLATGTPHGRAAPEQLARLTGLALTGLIQYLKAEKEKLEQLLMQDTLTGAYNSRALSRLLARQISLAKRYHDPFCLAMIDLDHFKLVNDRYGHLCGDAVLREFVQRVTSVLREGDLLARYGGDEFMLIAPNTTEDGATVAVDKIVSKMKEGPIYWDHQPINVTLSVGIAAFHLHEQISQRDLIQRTDRALYAAKLGGRDGVRAWNRDMKGSRSRMSRDEEDSVETAADQVQHIEAHQRRSAVQSIVGLLQGLRQSVPYVWDQTLSATGTAIRLATAAGLSAAEIERVRLATLVRDVGLIGVSWELLAKEGELTPDERQRIREHSAMSVKIIQPVSNLKDLLSIVLHHHERYNGSGYPMGLRATQIPVEARVIAIADTFDALISRRPYRAASSVAEAIQEISSRAGEDFDPDLVEVFHTVVPRLPADRPNPEVTITERVGA